MRVRKLTPRVYAAVCVNNVHWRIELFRWVTELSVIASAIYRSFC